MAIIGEGMRIVWRGDSSVTDFTTGDFTTDGNWHDLDLSGIVPKGTKAIYFSSFVSNALANKYFYIRRKGQTHINNSSVLASGSGGVYLGGNLIAFCDSNRLIEYMASNGVWAYISLVVSGWFV